LFKEQIIEKHDLAYLETQIKELNRTLARFADDTDQQEFLQLIRRPGYTTSAEIRFAGGIVDAMIGQLNV
jgi:hypothetical protein